MRSYAVIFSSDPGVSRYNITPEQAAAGEGFFLSIKRENLISLLEKDWGRKCAQPTNSSLILGLPCTGKEKLSSYEVHSCVAKRYMSMSACKTRKLTARVGCLQATTNLPPVSKSSQVSFWPPPSPAPECFAPSSVPTHSVHLISNVVCYSSTVAMDQWLKGLLVMYEPTMSYKLMRALGASLCDSLPWWKWSSSALQLP